MGACSAWLRTNATTELAPEVLVDDENLHAELVYKPVGVVGAIGPWNWPLMITIWQIGPSLRMGNTVVAKPSEYTPLSVLAMLSVTPFIFISYLIINYHLHRRSARA